MTLRLDLLFLVLIIRPPITVHPLTHLDVSARPPGQGEIWAIPSPPTTQRAGRVISESTDLITVLNKFRQGETDVERLKVINAAIHFLGDAAFLTERDAAQPRDISRLQAELQLWERDCAESRRKLGSLRDELGTTKQDVERLGGALVRATTAHTELEERAGEQKQGPRGA